MAITSKHIELDGLHNTRDLGGMIGAGGKKIKEGMLYRSAQLSTASEADKAFLADHLGLVVDFRTSQEASEKPNPVWDTVKNVWNPILEEAQLGITREEETDKSAGTSEQASMMMDPVKATAFMCQTYKNFFTDFGISQYEKFVRMLMDNDNKGALWHCTAGKDRAGFATIIVQSILGVSKEDIIADYMDTNKYSEGEIQKMYGYIKSQMPMEMPGLEGGVRALFGAKEEYIQTIFDVIGERWGSFDAFLAQALHLTDADIQAMRDKFLEA